MSLIDVRNVKKDFQLGKTTICALQGIDLEINAGEFACVVGPSGCGKSTLLNLIGCLDSPTSGTVSFEGKDLSKMSDDEQSELRLNKIGFIFQSFNLIPVLNVLENIELPLIMSKINISERKKRVQELVDLVGLTSFTKHKPDELSGGQRQRVAIARALINNPSIVIADEPTANLDSVTGEQILKVMETLNKEKKVTFVFSTHNLDILKYAAKIIRLKDGKVIEVSKPTMSTATPLSN